VCTSVSYELATPRPTRLLRRRSKRRKLREQQIFTRQYNTDTLQPRTNKQIFDFRTYHEQSTILIDITRSLLFCCWWLARRVAFASTPLTCLLAPPSGCDGHRGHVGNGVLCLRVPDEVGKEGPSPTLEDTGSFKLCNLALFKHENLALRCVVGVSVSVSVSE
jgi:hypothetical protein